MNGKIIATSRDKNEILSIKEYCELIYPSAMFFLAKQNDNIVLLLDNDSDVGNSILVKANAFKTGYRVCKRKLLQNKELSNASK